MFQRGEKGGRGRDLSLFLFYLRQIINPPLQQIQQPVGWLRAEPYLNLLGPTLQGKQRTAWQKRVRFGQENDAPGDEDKEDDAGGEEYE